MQLSPRLQEISDCVLQDHTFADIGTDHGYLAYALLKTGKCPRGIAADINSGPLSKAVGFFRGKGLEDRIEFRLGSGLTVLNAGECDDLIIAGMGGYLIRDILAESDSVARVAQRLILQPMNNADVLRQYLESAGYRIIDERICREEAFFYQIITAVPGEMCLGVLDALIGYEPARHENVLFLQFIDDLIVRNAKTMEQVLAFDTLKARQRVTECRLLAKELNRIKETVVL